MHGHLYTKYYLSLNVKYRLVFRYTITWIMSAKNHNSNHYLKIEMGLVGAYQGPQVLLDDDAEKNDAEMSLYSPFFKKDVNF